MSKQTENQKENRKRINEVLTSEVTKKLRLNTTSQSMMSESYTKKLGMVLDVVSVDNGSNDLPF